MEAPRLEGTSGWRGQWRWRLAGQHDAARRSAGRAARHGGHQGLRVGVARCGDHLVDRADLGERAEIEDSDAVGDLANTGAPKAGIFAEGAARVVARNLSAIIKQQEPTAKNPGTGSCYIEFGDGRLARVDVDFFSGPAPTGVFHEPSVELRADKKQFGATRAARWFNRPGA